jgi:hydrogenase maturation protein HypF
MCAMNDMLSIQRYVIRVSGVVQGVGFRPFIYQLAIYHGLYGWVRNTSGYVEIDVESKTSSLDKFVSDISLKAPLAARIEKVSVQEENPVGYSCFEILQSQSHTGEYQLISPDLATCPECVSEIMNPDDRRYRYAFTNCTNCGPRFTIIKDIPYDRMLTTMDKFQMCPRCQAEYDDPSNRRFHAQPNACPVCGPQLQLVQNNGIVVYDDEPISATAKLLREGKIVAIKGLGGFLLACDATNDEVVRLLRQRKKRPSKPFAVMVRDMDEAMKYCYVSEQERVLLMSTQSPIVLLKMKEEGFLAPSVAPCLKYLGVLLPYTPLHHLLMSDVGVPLVMTSGNLSEEPIAKDNDEALNGLSGKADYFLWHNRDIYVRYDDSVAMVAEGETRLARRARGYAPYPVHLPFNSMPILACGAEMKGAFCLTRDNHAFVSQHIGDMENAETLEHFQNTVDIYKRLFRINPGIIAHDMHPDYLSTRYALGLSENDHGLKLCPVQHHHAHIASCMAENGVDEQVIGVALDGTGYGLDDHIWGGEFLMADYKKCNRLAHLEYLPLPGGDSATKKPLRIAAAYLYYLMGEKTLVDFGLSGRMNDDELSLLKQQIDRKLSSPFTSSCGRLFDAVSALIGVRGSIDYEAQAAIELEMLATDFNLSGDTLYPFDIEEDNGEKIIRLGGLFDAILGDIRKNNSKAEIASRFHISLACAVACLCSKLSDETGIKIIALSGGVFQNRLLLHLTLEALKERNLMTISHKQVPTNDGGIALGQAAIANYADL